MIDITWEKIEQGRLVFYEATNIDKNMCVVHNNLSDFFAAYDASTDYYEKVWSISILIVDEDRDLRFEYDVREGNEEELIKIAQQKYNELLFFFESTI
jgi:hypothetical protein